MSPQREANIKQIDYHLPWKVIRASDNNMNKFISVEHGTTHCACYT